MISCTEFIPAYSELFSYIDEKDGYEAVKRFWDYLFKPDGKGIPLVNFVKAEGIKGCFTYWSGTLNEEAADFTMQLNEKAGWFKITMHRCPSKGRLLQLKDSLGITPYPNYCLHCDCYRAAVKQVGLDYIYDFSGTDKASCSLLIYDPKVFDGRVVVDENTVVMDRRAGDNEYFHPDFHSSMNMGIHYIGEVYGVGGVKEYITRYTNNVYGKLISEIKEKGISAIEEKIVDTYEKERATDAVEIKNDGKALTVSVKYCPAVKHLRRTGREVSAWYRYTTEYVMPILAESCGAKFNLEFYDEETGAARYSFSV